MKLQVISDLHLEFWKPLNVIGAIPRAADTLILAGDSLRLDRAHLHWTECRVAELCAKWKNIVFTPGNHEYYGTSFNLGRVHLLDLAEKFENFHYLDAKRDVLIDGQRFVGGTLWFPPSPGTSKWISDFQHIKSFEPGVYDEHLKLRLWLEETLQPEDVVVTHHAPSSRSIVPPFIGNSQNPWFCAPGLEALIVDRQPRLWVHGHMHSRHDYRIGQTRVICNPQGYPGEGCDFDPGFCVEV